MTASAPDFKGRTVLILGGDGFCGWPTALRFSSLGANVAILDNESRRQIDAELKVRSLTMISSLPERILAWAGESGNHMGLFRFDLATDYPALRNLLAELQPDIIVHFAEQRSAPYSMRSSEGARYSIDNNVRVTHNLLAALAETGLDPHLIHLGTIGVYGYANAGLQLPEGYLRVTAHGPDGRDVKKEIVYPGKPDSVYHLTKVLDQQLFAFYNQYYGLRITDLHQGVVWGTQTAETRRNPHLVNRFDHDPIFGTVVNRFIVQAIDGTPLTVYGSGEQARAFIHIRDMLTCITLAAETPPEPGERVRIVNQYSEICTLNALAARVSALTGAKIDYLKNPRREPEDNEFEVSRTILTSLGFEPNTFEDILAAEIADITDILATQSPDKSEFLKPGI
ncbi:NAD-dependent epimerase/dehydratase family protein [Ruegeria sp. 2012CJ41-6]|uniref:NAD-dependent epimerase/dehydratase family protein n=1 Tax=Ruegeria spongiae TaxID=2942209 RepID=A0ABT0Q746_9RHOB|nr:NAD-dependent epimerase/dehydratase family protein [Ruegeria spongiae]MCL6285645.1 NAD-dependent epimerase/dehydratase family protein [Ruegeria spongiae]